MDYELDLDDKGSPYLKVSVSDYALMANPLLNKGMSFTSNEREQFGLIGLLPPHVSNLETQRERSYLAFSSKPTDLEKYIYLRDLQDSNETLFYDLLCHHLEEMLPVIYTPTVGLGCQRFSHVYRRPRGIFIAYPYINDIDKILANPRFDHVRAIVVSDGERILGLGDQGAGGMGIPIGKLALYSACAGLHPSTTLPVLLDTGTNHPDLLKDPLYIGWKHERVRGQEYERLVDAFVSAVKKRFPHVLLQWEDFAQANANPLLARYRHQLCTFNDDIQGTAAVTVGTLLAAMHVTGISLRDQRIVIVGAGSAGCGIASLMMRAMMKEGLTEREALHHFYLIDKQGLLMDDMAQLQSFQKPFARSSDDIADWTGLRGKAPGLKETVQNIHPTVLIGVSGQAHLFSEEIIRDMAAHVARPVIFLLSNPISMSEASAEDTLRWTNDKAVIGTGSPAGTVSRFGKLFRVDQTNNCYIFPGLGLGLIAVKSRLVTDDMFMAAAFALAEASPAKQHPDANLLAPLSDIRKISFQVAVRVAKEAIASGLAEFNDTARLEEQIRRHMWTPAYLPYQKI